MRLYELGVDFLLAMRLVSEAGFAHDETLVVLPGEAFLIDWVLLGRRPICNDAKFC